MLDQYDVGIKDVLGEMDDDGIDVGIEDGIVLGDMDDDGLLEGDDDKLGCDDTEGAKLSPHFTSFALNAQIKMHVIEVCIIIRKCLIVNTMLSESVLTTDYSPSMLMLPLLEQDHTQTYHSWE